MFDALTESNSAIQPKKKIIPLFASTVIHSMLVRAAIDADAASQWVYPPTRLNHEPVSVILSIAVNFRIHSWETACARPVLI